MNRVFLYFHPSEGVENNGDMSSMIYLCRDSADNSEFVSSQVIAQMILNPNAFNPQFSTLKMRPNDLSTETKSAHIPSIEDCYALSVEAKSVIKWYLEKRHTIPRNLQHLVDPKPVLDFTVPPVRLCLDTMYLCLGTYTDAFQVLDVPLYECMVMIQIYKAKKSDKRGPFNIMAFDPVVCPSWIPQLHHVPLNTRIVCWNVRGVGRNSILEKFRRMHDHANPSVVVLLETRHFDENMNEVISHLPWRFRIHTLFIHSCSGGTAILYKKELIKMVGNPLYSNYALNDAVIQGKEQAEPRNLKLVTPDKVKLCRG